MLALRPPGGRTNENQTSFVDERKKRQMAATKSSSDTNTLSSQVRDKWNLSIKGDFDKRGSSFCKLECLLQKSSHEAVAFWLCEICDRRGRNPIPASVLYDSAGF